MGNAGGIYARPVRFTGASSRGTRAAAVHVALPPLTSETSHSAIAPYLNLGMQYSTFLPLWLRPPQYSTAASLRLDWVSLRARRIKSGESRAWVRTQVGRSAVKRVGGSGERGVAHFLLWL